MSHLSALAPAAFPCSNAGPDTGQQVEVAQGPAQGKTLYSKAFTSDVFKRKGATHQEVDPLVSEQINHILRSSRTEKAHFSFLENPAMKRTALGFPLVRSCSSRDKRCTIIHGAMPGIQGNERGLTTGPRRMNMLRHSSAATLAAGL